MRFYVGMNTGEKMRAGAALGAPAVLTNSNGNVRVFGTGTTLDEATKILLEESGIRVFQSIHGRDVEEIVATARRIHAIDPQKVGVKILSDTKGFTAMRVLSAEGIDCIATGLFTLTQACVAAQVGAYAISPFVARGMEAGLDMYKMIRLTRECYDRMKNPPEILAASIRTIDHVYNSFAAGADAVATSYEMIEQMCNHPFSRQTELSFGEAFAQIKGEDVSYLPLAGRDPLGYQE